MTVAKKPGLISRGRSLQNTGRRQKRHSGRDQESLTASWRASTIPTPTPTTRAPNPSSRRSRPPTTSCPIPRSASSTTPAQPSSAAAVARRRRPGVRSVHVQGHVRRRRRRTVAAEPAASAISSTCSAVAAAAMARRAAPARGADLTYVLNLSFDDALKGVTTKIAVDKNIQCPVCHGSGAEPGTSADHLPRVRRPRRDRPEPGFLRSQPGLPSLRRRRQPSSRIPAIAVAAPASSGPPKNTRSRFLPESNPATRSVSRARGSLHPREVRPATFT